MEPEEPVVASPELLAPLDDDAGVDPASVLVEVDVDVVLCEVLEPDIPSPADTPESPQPTVHPRANATHQGRRDRFTLPAAGMPIERNNTFAIDSWPR